MSLNVCTFSGRLGRDAEQKYLPTGTAVLEFSIAVDTGFGDKRRSFWLKCDMFGDRGPKLAQYLTKGQQVAVSGEFDPRQYKRPRRRRSDQLGIAHQLRRAVGEQERCATGAAGSDAESGAETAGAEV